MFTTLIYKKAFEQAENFTKIPEKMIAMYSKYKKGYSLEAQFRFFEVNDIEIKKMEIPVAEDEQLKLPDQFKQMTQEVRNEFRFYQ